MCKFISLSKPIYELQILSLPTYGCLILYNNQKINTYPDYYNNV